MTGESSHTAKADRPPVIAGAIAYGEAFGRAGGDELVSLARSADDTAVHVGVYNAPAYHLTAPALAVSRLAVPLTYSRISGALEGDRIATYHAPRHAVYLTPAHAAARWSKDRPSRHLTIYFHASAFFGDVREDGRLDESAAGSINAATQRVLPGVGGIVNALYAELESPDAFTAEAADCLARLLLVRLARMWADPAKSASRITPLILQRVKDYVQASLSERISVSQMAAVAGLSANRFAHAFADHTGQSPHQYVLTQRLNRAASLLARSRMSVAEVAVASGFCSQQHLTNTMRLRLGMTPARYRASLGCESGRPALSL